MPARGRRRRRASAPRGGRRRRSRTRPACGRSGPRRRCRRRPRGRGRRSPAAPGRSSGGRSRRTTTTSAPRSSSARLRCEPIRPSAPVTSTERPRSVPASISRPARRQPRGGGRVGVPQVVERDRVLVGVHAVPEARDGGRPRAGRRRPAPTAARARAPTGRRAGASTAGSRQKNPALIQCSDTRLLVEPGDALAVAAAAAPPRTAVAVARPPSSPSPPALIVVVDQRAEVDVGDRVGVGQAEAIAASSSAARCRRPPVGVSSPVSTQRIRTSAGQAALRGEGRDPIAAVAGQQQEVGEPLADVDRDHVPEDRPAADLDQRLGNRLGVLVQPGATPAAEDRHAGSHGGGLSGMI